MDGEITDEMLREAHAAGAAFIADHPEYLPMVRRIGDAADTFRNRLFVALGMAANPDGWDLEPGEIDRRLSGILRALQSTEAANRCAAIVAEIAARLSIVD